MLAFVKSKSGYPEQSTKSIDLLIPNYPLDVRAAMLGDLIAGLIRKEDLDWLEEELPRTDPFLVGTEDFFYKAIWKNVRSYRLATPELEPLGYFCEGSMTVADGFGGFIPHDQGQASVWLEDQATTVELTVNESGNLSHLFLPA